MSKRRKNPKRHPSKTWHYVIVFHRVDGSERVVQGLTGKQAEDYVKKLRARATRENRAIRYAVWHVRAEIVQQGTFGKY